MAMMIPRLVLGVVTAATFSVTMAGPLEAQYRYTDEKGVTKTTQYKLDVPSAYRETAEWVGARGIGKPALSEEARQTKMRDDAYRRIGEANEQLRSYGGSAYDTPKEHPSSTTRQTRIRSKAGSSSVSERQREIRGEIPVMCIAGERRVMTGPGHWEVRGTCGSGDAGSWSSR